jgi:hypothetical protein
MAIENLEKKGKVELSAAQKAMVVSNLLIQLCADKGHYHPGVDIHN